MSAHHWCTLVVVSQDSKKDSESAAGSEAVLFEAARLFFEEYRLSVPGGSPGYSGSVFAQVDSSGKRWLLRRWPIGFDEGRLRFIHRALLESRASGFRGVPRLARTERGQTIVRIGGRLYEAQERITGAPLSAQPPAGGTVPNEAVRTSFGHRLALAEALARFHRSTSRLRPEPEHDADPLPERLHKLSDEVEARREALVEGARSRARGEECEIALRWLELLSHAVSVAREASEKFFGDPGKNVLCHGDLWPSHVHFDGEVFVGFADFESLAFASPALDLAQLVAHFGGWDAREDVVRSYERLAPFGERNRAALPLEAVADLAGEGLWSLEALYGESSGETTRVQGAAHRSNLRVLLECLEDASREAEAVAG